MLCNEFHAAYEVSEVTATFAPSQPVLEFRATGNLAPSARIDAVITAGSPGQTWRGHFFGHRDGADLLAHTPDPDHLLAVAGGVAYWVPTANPEGFRVISFQPVRSVHCSLNTNLVILEGYTRLVALDRNGETAWESDQLVSDGFVEVRLAGPAIVVRGYSAPEDGEIEMTLDTVTGTIVSHG